MHDENAVYSLAGEQVIYSSLRGESAHERSSSNEGREREKAIILEVCDSTGSGD